MKIKMRNTILIMSLILLGLSARPRHLARQRALQPLRLEIPLGARRLEHFPDQPDAEPDEDEPRQPENVEDPAHSPVWARFAAPFWRMRG
jgi:hypothetical protein